MKGLIKSLLNEIKSKDRVLQCNFTEHKKASGDKSFYTVHFQFSIQYKTWRNELSKLKDKLIKFCEYCGLKDFESWEMSRARITGDGYNKYKFKFYFCGYDLKRVNELKKYLLFFANKNGFRIIETSDIIE